jgi:hypothetical protein
MARLLLAVITALLVMGLASTAHAEGYGLAAGPATQADQPVMSLKLLDSYRARNEAPVHRIKVSNQKTTAETEQPGETLTVYVERVWSQARVYRRPGGAELILRGKF